MPMLHFVKVQERSRPAIMLFSTYHLESSLAHQLGMLDAEVDGFPTDYLLNVDDAKLHQYLEEKYLVEVPHLDYASTQISETAIKIDVSQDRRRALGDRSRPLYVDATAVTFHVPIVGQAELIQCSPNVVFMGNAAGPPEGRVADGEVQLTYTVERFSTEQLQQNFDRDSGRINNVLRYVATQIDGFNETARSRLRTRIGERRSRISQLASGLKFPLRIRVEQSESTAPSLRRKLLPPRAYTEPTLELRQYEEVLKALENAATAIERAPSAFARMTEEEIRHHFLIGLNTVFQGSTSAEAFNASGKTDILIRVDGKTIFIAECKFWRGKKSFLQAIDQLLGYVSWRDTKTALIILNRGRNLSAILEQIPSLVCQHSNYLRDSGMSSETSLRFTMHHNDDRAREILLAVLIFEVPSEGGQ